MTLKTKQRSANGHIAVSLGQKKWGKNPAKLRAKRMGLQKLDVPPFGKSGGKESTQVESLFEVQQSLSMDFLRTLKRDKVSPVFARLTEQRCKL
ncbi:hypothetical protein WN51_08583 [Melipona quadrifasciata]|uniref:Uncharacterized protein n=1 Tax=Melipona quadrifasciata TaxID=166423 RepID=A0A0N0U764_9HYME|nr:hypothetical protein WN51_08583 [Melipona quadrifasciata]